jgi:restriction endonuclease
MKRIYISSSFKHVDDFLSFQLKEELIFSGYEVINPSRNEIVHSSEIKESVEFLINKCDLFIAILKDNNPWQYFELGYAIASSKKVLIVADYDIEIPYPLKNYQFLRTGLDSSNSIFDIIRYLEKLRFGENKESEPINTLEEFNSLLEIDRQTIDKVSGPEFELLIAKFFESKGFNVKQADSTSDYGFDLIINNYEGHNKTIVEVKKYNRNSKVSVNTIHQVFGTMNICEADHAIIITTSDFTSSAKDFAQSFPGKLELWNYETLNEKINTTHNNG